MIAEGIGWLAELGGIAGIVATIGSILITLWATQLSARAKKQAESVAAVKVGQQVLLDGVAYSERSNRELRSDLTLAEERIEQLRTDLRSSERECAQLRVEVRENEIRCKQELRVLTEQIRQLSGSASD